MSDHRIIFGNVEDVLASLDAGSADTCITSPPYFGLRSYSDDPREIGKEATPAEYVERLVGVFREVKRVLKDSGTLWLVLGDSYVAHLHQRKADEKAGPKQTSNRGSLEMPSRSAPGLKPKDLVGIPWRVALALQADGWWLRRDVIWYAPDKFCESVKDRPQRKHEYVFLLAKAARYWEDFHAVREAYAGDEERLRGRVYGGKSEATSTFVGEHHPLGKMPGTVWVINCQGTSFGHYATFPQALAERCMKAGCPPQVCNECGAPYEHRIQIVGEREHPLRQGRTKPAGQFTGEGYEERESLAKVKDVRDLGYHPACQCHAETIPGLVLDPFCGSGTVAQTARKLGRRSIGIELQPDYEKVIRQRLDLGGLFDEVEFEYADNLAPAT